MRVLLLLLLVHLAFGRAAYAAPRAATRTPNQAPPPLPAGGDGGFPPGANIPPPPPGPPADFVDDSDFDEGDDMPDDYPRAAPPMPSQNQNQLPSQAAPAPGSGSSSGDAANKFGNTNKKIRFKIVKGAFLEPHEKRPRGESIDNQ
jgi:hypothetical protein